MMKCNTLFEEFKRFEGQPVEIFTDDGRKHCGIDIEAFETAVRIIDDCGRTQLIEFRHIDAVVEPMMRLRRCCNECKCHRDRDEDENGDRDRDDDFDFDEDDDDDCNRRRRR